MRIHSRAGLRFLAAGALLVACGDERPTFPPGSPTHLAFLDAAPASTVSLQPLTPMRVAFMTGDDQIAASHSGTISLLLVSPDTTAHLIGVVSGDASGGIVTFGDLTIDRAGAGYTLLARSESLPDAASSAFSIVAGAAAKLRFAIRPSTAVAGDTMTVSVGFADAGGNPVTDANAVITLGALSASQDSVFGAGTAASVSGVATFQGVSIHKAGNQSLVATAPGFGSVQSAPMLVESAPLSTWRFETQPTSGIAGVTLPSTVVRCTDQYGNPPTFPGAYLSTQVTLTFGENPDGAILTGTLTRFGQGFVDFNDLKIDKPGAGYSLSLTPVSGYCGQFPGATSATFNISP